MSAEYSWTQEQGACVITSDECWFKSLAALMLKIRQQLGNGPGSIIFDIDCLDPDYASGTGTAEMTGLTVHQGIEIVRGCRGMKVVGDDLVEVSPPYDLAKNTSIVAVNLLYEMLCVLSGITLDSHFITINIREN